MNSIRNLFLFAVYDSSTIKYEIKLISSLLHKNVFHVVCFDEHSKEIKKLEIELNSIRGLLGEYGIVLPRGRSVLRYRIHDLLDDTENL